MSFKQAVSGLIGVGFGSGIASFFWGSSSSSSSTEVSSTSSAPNNLVPPSRAPDGKLSLVGLNIDPSGFFQYGFPGPVHDLQTRDAFVSCFDRQTRNPYWVVEHITPESLAKSNADRNLSSFMEDTQIPNSFRGRLKDYFRSGYDRGHQAPAADSKFSQDAMNQTFYLTNMSPQVGEGFNRDYWAHLESFCRSLTRTYNSVRIVTGPLYLPKKDPVDGKFRVTYEVIGNPPNIAVPTHFFKLIVAESPSSNPTTDNISVAAFVLPNEVISNSTKLTEFEVPINALERSSGLEFLQKVPENKRKALCKEVNCQITVRQFKNALPAPKPVLSLPPPKD